MPKHPNDLLRSDLEDIVWTIQQMLFVDVRGVWNPDKEVNGADFVEAMTSLLDEYELAPKTKE